MASLLYPQAEVHADLTARQQVLLAVELLRDALKITAGISILPEKDVQVREGPGK